MKDCKLLVWEKDTKKILGTRDNVTLDPALFCRSGWSLIPVAMVDHLPDLLSVAWILFGVTFHACVDRLGERLAPSSSRPVG